MRKLITGSAVLCLALFASTSLIWAEQETKVEKSETVEAETCAKRCEKAMTCHKAGASAAEGSEFGCVKTQARHSAQGCCSMMSPMRLNPMMRKMRLGGGMKRSMPGKKGPGMARALHRLGSPGSFIHKAEELELSQEQVDKLKALKWDQQKAAIEQKSRIQVARVELAELLDQKDVDFGKVKAKSSQIADLEKEMQLVHLTTIEKSRKILTPEQLEQAKSLKKQRGHGMQKSPHHIVKEIIIEETAE
jgi:Spy/CpxP family protein refolding chaperone